MCISILGCTTRFEKFEIPEYNENSNSSDLVAQYLNTESAFSQEVFTQKLMLSKKNHWKGVDPLTLDNIDEMKKSSSVVNELLMDYYLNKRQMSIADECAKTAELLGANNPEYWRTRAQLYAELGQYDKAIDYINKAIMFNRSDYTLYKEKGTIYLSMNDTASAIQFFELVFQNDPNQISIINNLSMLYTKSGNQMDAQMMIDRALANDSSNIEILYLKAEWYESNQSNASALAIYGKISELGDAEASLRLYDIYMATSMYDSALYWIDKAIINDNKNLDLLVRKAKTSELKGNLTSALLNYNNVLAIDPTHADALEGIKIVNGKIAYLRKLKERREAVPTFDFVSPRKK